METETEIHYHCQVFELGGLKTVPGFTASVSRKFIEIIVCNFVSLLLLPGQVEQDHCREPTHCLVSVLAPLCSPGSWDTVPAHLLTAP